MSEYFRKCGSKPEVWVFEDCCFTKKQSIEYLIKNGYSREDSIEYLELVKAETIKGIIKSVEYFSNLFNR